MDLAPGALNAGITNMQEAKDCTKGVQAVVSHSLFPIEKEKENPKPIQAVWDKVVKIIQEMGQKE